MHRPKPHYKPLPTLALLLLTLVTAPVAWAQTAPCGNPSIITIGNGTSTSDYLLGYTFYNYSFTEQIYRQQELGNAMLLYGMAVNMSAVDPSRHISIYLGHTSQNAVDDWILPNDLTLVWDGTTQFSTGNWSNITFNTTFDYNGSDNLLLLIIDNTGSWHSSPDNTVYTHSNGGYNSRYTYNDNTAYSATTAPTTTNGTTTTQRMNVKWLGCTPQCGLISNLSVNSVGTHSAFIEWTLVNPTPSTQVTLQYDDNSNFNSPQTVTATTPPYALTGLTPNTTYYVRATLSCNEGTTDIVSETSFTTQSLPCEQYSGSSTISIGTGSSTSIYLWGNYLWKYSYSEQIYRHSELGGAATITGMAVEIAEANRSRDLLIYLGHTSQSSVSSWIMPSDLTLVWSGTVQYNANSWNNISFNAPFLYNGTDNLLLLIVDQTGDYTFGQTNSVKVHTNSGYDSRYVQSDNTSYSASTVPSESGTTTTSRANVRWYINNCVNQVDCEVPAIYVSDITDNEATLRIASTRSGAYHIYLGEENATPTFVSTTTNSTYTLTGLEPFTHYQVRVSLDCSESTVDLFAEEQFVTQPCRNYTSISIPESITSSTTNYYLWGYSWYNYAFTEQIYRQSELGASVDLFGMAVQVGNAPRERAISIYLGHTSQTSVTNWIMPNDLTLVWSGTTHYAADSWNDIIFSTPFAYNGNDNLLLLIVDQTGTNNSSPYNSVRVHENDGYTSRYTYNDGTPYSANTIPSSTGTSSNYRTNVRWYGCLPPCGYINHLTVNSVGTNSAYISWTLNYPPPSTQVTLQYDDNSSFSSPQTVTVTGYSTYALTGLLPNTTYYVRISVSCEEGSTSYTSTQFTTAELPCADYTSQTRSIGNGTSTTSYLWSYSYYKYAFTEQIYRQSELGSATTLDGMEIQVSAANMDRDISIYLGHTNQNSVDSWIMPTDQTLVWSGTTHFNSGWNSITFSTPFEYNGIDNLLLLVIDHTGDWESPTNSYYVHTNSGYNSRYIYNDNGAYSSTTAPTSTGTSTTNRMNVRWHAYQCINHTDCSIPAIIVQNVSDHSAVVRWTSVNSSLYSVYLSTGNATPTLVGTTTDTSYTLNGLEGSTTYHVQIYAACAGGTDPSNTSQFTTLPPGLPVPQIVDINVPAELCAGDVAQISIGHDTSSGIVIYTPEATMGHSERIFLPDGVECNGECSYHSPVTFTSFPIGATISSVEDIKYVRLNLEHSYIGDLYISITCPNGSTASLMNQWGDLYPSSSCAAGSIPAGNRQWTSGNNASEENFFGLALDEENGSYPCDSTASGNGPGIGWNYCWSDNTTSGYSYAPGDGLIYRAANTHNGSIDSSNVSAGTNFYHPNQSFSNLIGCPLNGTWSIEVIDAWQFDNGYIFSWDLTLNPSMVVPGCPVTERHVTGPYTTQVNDSIFVINVPEDLAEDTTVSYTFTAITSCGTQADTTVTILLHPATRRDDIQEACDSYTWINDITYSESTDTATYRTTNTMGCDSVVTLHLTLHHNDGTDDTATACDSYHWPYRATTITTGGSYEESYTDEHNCTGTHRLQLTLNNSSTGDTTAEACDQYDWYEYTGITSSGSSLTHTFSAANQYGCDSTVTLHLTINRNNGTSETKAACNSFEWEYRQDVITESGQYEEYYTDEHGCEGTHRLDLTINTESYGDTTAVVCDQYDWYEHTGITYSCNNLTHIFTDADHNGCDSIVTLMLIVNNSNSGVDVQDVCDLLTWHGTTYTASTDTPTHRSTNAAGCDSTTTLHLTVRYSTTGIDEQSVCDQLTWHGTTYTASTNTPTHHSTNAVGCDSTTTLHLTVRYSNSSIDTRTACDSLRWHDSLYTVSTNTPTYHSTNAAGCDSTTTLNLTVNNHIYAVDEHNVCDSLVWHGTTYYASTNSPTYNSTAATGCDSTTTLHLIVRHSTSGIDEQDVCDQLLWHGTTYTFSTNTPTHHSTNAVGCDSTTTLHLTVRHSTTGIDEQVACNRMRWHGNFYTESTNTPTYHSTNAAGCDSTTTLHLTINHSSSGIDTRTVCDSLRWHDSLYTVSTNTPTYHSTNAAGCDSTTTLNLTVNNHIYAVDEHNVCDSLVWHGTTYYASTNSPTYNSTAATGCDSTTTLHLIVRHSTSGIDEQDVCDQLLWHGTTYTFSTNTPTHHSTNAVGCDSTTTLHLTVRHSTTGIDEQVACNRMRWHGNFYTESTNTPTYHSTNAAGCDSTTTLHLTINHSSSGIDTRTVCDSLRWHDSLYTVSTNTPTYHSTNAAGCDSTTTLNLTVNNHIYAVDEHNVCDSLVWHGTTYYASTNSPTYNSTAATGCDSTTTLHLIVRHSTSGIDEQDVCDQLLWHGTTYTFSTNTPTHHSTNAVGCDSTTTLHLTVRHSTTGIDEQSSCDSYVWIDGNTYTTSNNTAQFTLHNAENCDSTVTLHLIVRYSTTGTDVQNVCDSLTWHGTTYRSSTNTPTYHSTNAAGCDSTTTLRLTVRHSSSGIDIQSVCDSLIWNGVVYRNSTNTPTHHSTNAAGCDSTVTLHLTVRHSTAGIDEQNVCDSYRWIDGHTYTESNNTAQYTIHNAAGCDSTVTLHLTVRHSSGSTETYTVCDSMEWHGRNYTESTQTATYTTQNVVGCDSTVTLHLTVNHSTHLTLPETACERYIWHDSTYNTSGTYRYEFIDANSCASSETLQLRIVHGTHQSFEEIACERYTWNRMTFTEDGTYTYDYTNDDGCASTDTLHLTLLESSHSDTSAAACESYHWDRNGITYTESGVYVYEYLNEAECPSHDTLHLTIHEAYTLHRYDTICEGERITFAGEIYTDSGQYTAQLQSLHGCDSTVTLHLLVRQRPQVEIEAEYGCPLELWELTTTGDGERYTWSANMGNHQLSGHEHDTVIRFHAQDSTLITLTADYASGRSCPSFDQVTLAPIVNVTAEIECRPEVLSQEHPEIKATDISSGHNTRQWYVDGVAWGSDPIITCVADRMADEMVLLLIASNDHCADTTERILLSTNESLFIPNVFTPTQSTNSTFRAHGSGILEYQISIYNREGLLVFRSDQLTDEWDGTHDGEPCPQGSYVYQIRYRGRSIPDGWQTRTGAVTLLR